MSAFKPGDVVSYTPLPEFPGQRDVYWCREGLAIAKESGVLIDTYWATMSDAHVLTEGEIASAVLKFNIADYDEIGPYRPGSRNQWMRYAPEDRQIITSQHRLQARYFVRKGATEDLATQVANKREEIAKAEADRDYAARKVEWLNRELADLEASAAVTQ